MMPAAPTLNFAYPVRHQVSHEVMFPETFHGALFFVFDLQHQIGLNYEVN